MSKSLFAFAAAALTFRMVFPVLAQVDPKKRQLLHLGYNHVFQGRGPISGYLFYYLNRPRLAGRMPTLRLALAPVYLDAEFAFPGLISSQTDLAFGLSGGGFADSYSEIRAGRLVDGESFTGHGGAGYAAMYHCLNPGRLIPLVLSLRGTAKYSTYAADSDTAPDFALPAKHLEIVSRLGLRWGGQEPVIFPRAAMEVSGWYENVFRAQHGAYGFAEDRRLQADSHLFWARALLTYTFEESLHRLNANVTLGGSENADRFNAYRLGGALPLGEEFPLSLPGYHYQEISADRFVLLGVQYSFPLSQRWDFSALANSAKVHDLPGLEQPADWHAGLGGGPRVRSSNGAWQVALNYAYGWTAIRDGKRGAHSLAFLFQYDFEAPVKERKPYTPRVSPERSRGLERILDRLNILK